jgi:sugar lactone lactonase YvrE
VSGTVTVAASASDDVGVAGVQFQLDGAPLGAEGTTAPYSVGWDTTAAANGTHTVAALARDGAGNASSASVTVTVSNAGFAKGDVFVAIVDGTVQWRGPDGTLRATLTSTSDGQVSSLAFDGEGRLYAPHWWGKTPGTPGNLVARFDVTGAPLGNFGGGYNCNPSSLAFDTAGNVYIGQADCTGDILKLDPAGNLLASIDVATVNRGTDHIDLGPDGCTIFYTSRSQDVLRFDVCTNTQLPAFNTQPLPGEAAYHVRALPDGGVLVADSHVIVRLDASGSQVQSYFAPGEPNYWGGVDSAGDGTFWASNAYNGNIYRFDLQSGAVVGSFNTGTGNFTAAGVAVKP